MEIHKNSLPDELAQRGYSIEQVTKLLPLSEAFLRKEIRNGRLKATHFGRRVLILAEDLDNYLLAGSNYKDLETEYR